MNRISRIAHRLGVVLAVPLVTAAVVGAAFNLKTRWAPLPHLDLSSMSDEELRQAHAGQAITNPKVVAQLDAISRLDDDRIRQSNDGLLFLGLVGALGPVIYAAVRALGWIINGWQDQS